MSNRAGRRWTYRLSSIVRPTPHSSRDPSPPRQNIEPPSSPTASSSSPPSPRSPLHQTKPTPALSSPELRHERVTTRQEVITYSAEMFPPARSSHPPPPQPMLPPVQEAKPRQERDTTRQEILAFPVKPHATNGPNKENQQQIVEGFAQAARPSHLPPPKPRHELETTRQEILAFPVKTHATNEQNKEPEQQVSDEVARAARPSHKPRHERETTRQEILAFPVKPHATNEQNKEPEQQIIDELAQAAQPSHHPPPKPMSPPLPKEIQEAKPSPVTSSRYKQHEPPNPKEEHETTHQKNILPLSNETNLVHEPKEILPSEFDGDVFMDTQDVVTISADNKGAVMEILRSLDKTRRPSSLSNDNKRKEAKSKNYIKNGGNCFVNSNVQMVNGSVVYNSSESHHDPGVNLSLYRIPSSGNGYIIKDHGKDYTSSINSTTNKY